MSPHPPSNEPADRELLDRYRRRYRCSDAAIALFDSLLSLILPASARRRVLRPQRILLANYGHLGDVVMSTAAISVLKAAMPDVRIGYLLGSWSRPVLERHPAIERLHVLDHWFMDRGPTSRFVKAPRYWRACLRMAEEIRAARYDAAIDLRAYLPNAIPVLYLAQIPVRIGYTSSGCGPLLTHPVRFVYRREHESAIQVELLKQLGVEDRLLINPPFRLPPHEAGRTEVRAFLVSTACQNQPYRVMHVGGSVPVRDWPMQHWRSLAARLIGEGRRPIFTGTGSRDRALIDAVVAGLPHCVSACDKLSWAGVVELVRGAELVYSVETATGHVAVAVGTPCVGIYGGTSDTKHWSPRPGPGSACVTNVVPCRPCFQYNGCEHMSCLRNLSAERVYRAGEDLLKCRMTNNE